MLIVLLVVVILALHYPGCLQCSVFQGCIPYLAAHQYVPAHAEWPGHSGATGQVAGTGSDVANYWHLCTDWDGAWYGCKLLTHWGWATQICISKLSTIGSDNGLSPGRRQAIIWTNVGILSITTFGTNFSEHFNKIHIFSFKKMHLKMSSGKCRPFCLGLNVLTPYMCGKLGQCHS